MTSSLISTIRDDFLESGSLSSNAACESDTNSTSSTSLVSRKRRRGAATNLTRINLSSAKLSVSNESLNSNSSSGGPTTLLTATLSDDDLGEDSASSTNVFEFDKRSRLCSQSVAPSVNGIVANGNINTLTPTEDCFNLIELECANGGGNGSTTSVKPLASGGLVIGRGTGAEYEIVGDGRECKAVNIQQQSVFHCLVFKPEEYRKFVTVLERIQVAAKFYDAEEYKTLKNIVIPEGFKAIRAENGMWYILLPDHYGNLHSLVDMNSNGTSNLQRNNKSFSERRVQPIFKQIVNLVNFCHKIGIYFRDFRLRKFVFTNKQRTQIRLNNVLELWIAPEIDNDQMSQRHVCPAYVAPEILDVRSSTYAGKSADVWALGVLMFILLSGRYPFYEDSNNPRALFKRIRARRFSFAVDDYITHNARWLLFGILRTEPKDRPTAEEILQSHWLQTDRELLPDGREFPTMRQKTVEASLSFNNMASTIIPPLNQSNAVHRRMLATATLASRIASALRNETNSLMLSSPNGIASVVEMESLQQTSPQLQRSLSAGIAQDITLNGLFMGNGGSGGATNNDDANEDYSDQIVPEIMTPFNNSLNPTESSLLHLSNDNGTELSAPRFHSSSSTRVSPPLHHSSTFPMLLSTSATNSINIGGAGGNSSSL